MASPPLQVPCTLLFLQKGLRGVEKELLFQQFVVLVPPLLCPLTLSFTLFTPL
jgi:hypothetical protein